MNLMPAVAMGLHASLAWMVWVTPLLAITALLAVGSELSQAPRVERRIVDSPNSQTVGGVNHESEHARLQMSSHEGNVHPRT
jgi:hypothetical protein